MPEINPLTNNQIFLKKIAENTGSDYETGDVSEINPLTIDQIFLKEIAANTAGQSGDITELEEKVSATQDIISDAYDSTHTYNVGDYCIYEDVLYKCNTASTTGDWDASKWAATTVSGEIDNVKSRLIKIQSISVSGTLDADGNLEIPSLTQNDYPIAFLGDIGSAGVVIFWDGSGAAGYQHYCRFLTLSSTSVSGTVIYLTGGAS